MRKDPSVSVWFSDAHFPKHDRRAWACFIDVLRKLRSRVRIAGLLCGGDHVDLATMTHHEKSPDDYCLTLGQELKAGRESLAEAKDAADPDEAVFLSGNHEYRLDRWIASGACPRAVVDMMPPNAKAGLRLVESGWRFLDRGDQPHVYRGIALHHGFWYGRHHAAKHADELAVDNLYGHTHRPQQFTRMTMRGPVTATGSGCLRLLERDWEHMKARPYCGWSHGIAILSHGAERTSVSNVLIENGRAEWGGINFRAR